jgi:general secretion pathway protein D
VKTDSIRLVTLAVLATACASTPSTKPAPYQVGATVSAPPSLPPASSGPIVPQTSTAGAPPTMASAPPSIVGTPSSRVSISAHNEDLSSVIDRVARQVGLTAIIDPAVRGPVTRSLQGVSLNDAMLSLVGSSYRYQVRNNTLVVSPVQLVQHTYTVNYLNMSRISTGSTVVSRGTQGASATSNTSLVSGAGGSGTGTGVSSTGAGLVASGADVIQSSSQADVWGELTMALESIIFGSSSDSTRGAVAATVSQVGGRAYNRCEGRVCLRISPLTSLVDVTASPEKQDEISRYIALFSGAINRQVLIKAQVVEVGLDRTRNYGIDWQAVLNTAKVKLSAGSNANGAIFPADLTAGLTSTGPASFNIGIGDLTLRAVLSALETVGDVSVVANPSTTAMNQQKASFNVTRQQQFFSITRTPIVSPTTGAITGYSETPQIQTATVGLVFDVLPQISDDNVVQMAIRPSMTSLVGKTQIQGANGGIQAELPVIDHRETDTMARVRSGETIIIGGLIQKQETTTRTGIPLLKDLPLFGRLFSSTRIETHNSELVIFVTPEIVSGQPPRIR